jgi:hypothetical protein
MNDSDPAERRVDARIRAEERVFAEITACEARPELIGRTFSCSTQNVSVRGIRLNLAVEVPLGAGLQLSVGLGGKSTMLDLEGRVAWVTESDPAGFFMLGIEFDESSPGYGPWAQALEARSDDSPRE